ncbi:MAG TPA: ABC transporter substrate-binding protein [Stellaceae bacterium]
MRLAGSIAVFGAIFGAVAVGLATLPAAAQISDHTIKIAVLDDFSGQYCTGNCMGPVTAVRIAADEFGGKIAGAPIEIIWGDHQNKPDVAVALVNKWFDREQVDAIADITNSSVALGANRIARDKGRAVLMSSTGSPDFTGKECAPYTTQWTFDTYQFGKSIAQAVPMLGKTWFIVAPDYLFGKTLAANVEKFVTKAGGKVLGTVVHPFGTSDMSSFMLQAQSSGAKVIALANAGGDMTNAIKTAKEFGLVDAGIKIVPLSLDLPFMDGVGGLAVTQGMMMTLPWYPGLKPEAMKFAQEFKKRQGVMPGYLMAGLYSVAHNYLLAIKATGTDNPKAVFAKMRATPVNDAFATNGVLRPDGRMVHDVYLVQVKKPSESTGPDDLVKLIATIPGDKAFRPMSEGGCPYVNKS